MESFNKGDLLDYMEERGWTPHTDELDSKLESFLLAKFNVRSCDIEDYKKFHNTVIDFRTKIRAFLKDKKVKYNKDQLISKHRVRLHFQFTITIHIQSPSNASGCLDISRNLLYFVRLG